MIESQWFSLSPSVWTIVFAVLLIGSGLTLSILSIRRAVRPRWTWGLEFLRLLIIAMVAIVICQPEWLQKYVPREEPVLLVSWDQSNSMNTVDVKRDNASAAISRAESIQPMINDKTWESFQDKYKVIVEPFSSGLKDSQKASDINEALSQAVEKHNNLRAVVLLTDGQWNYGRPPTEAATQLRMKKVPVYAIGVGSETALPDVGVLSLDAPTFGVVNKPTRVPFSVQSTFAKELVIDVTLRADSGEEMKGQYRIPANGILQEAFVWRPKKVGEYSLTLSIPPLEGEQVTNNNELQAPISIRKESLKVLVVESFPRWEYRFLRNALSRDPGVDVSCLLFHPSLKNVGGGKDYIKEFPQTKDALAKFDVIFLGDVGVKSGQLTEEDCRKIRGLVESQATGLILMPGLRGNQLTLAESPLKELFPVVFDPTQPKGWGNRIPAKFQLTEAGSQSLLTKLADTPENNIAIWRSLPGFQWYAGVERAKAGSQVLAVHERERNLNGRIPLLVTKTFGAGKILFMGTDGAWRWRKGVEDKYHYRFWGQVVRWMAYQRNMAGGEGMRLFYTPDRPKTGETLSLNANVMSLDGEPLQNGTVSIQIVAPSGNSQNIRLAPEQNSELWGLFTGFFIAEESGEHVATLTCKETGSSLQTTINVQGVEREKLGKPPNLQSLEEIAGISRGKLLALEESQSLIDQLGQLPEPEAQVKRVRLWAHPVFAFAFLGLLTLFWVGRKMAGEI